MKKIIFLPLLFSLVILSGFRATADLPVVTVRFANPVFGCPPLNTYCLDVEFISNTPGVQVFGCNVRFFYDDKVLEFLSIGDFVPGSGYDTVGAPVIETGPPGSGAPFEIDGTSEWINGVVELKSNPSPIYLSTTTWTKLFNICFHIDDPLAIGIGAFCPPIIWDLQENPSSGGYLTGDDGVVVTMVNVYPKSSPTTENVDQYNWMYAATGSSFGHPVSKVCIPTKCGTPIPLSNWSLFLGIGLMIVVSIFIYKRRISG